MSGTQRGKENSVTVVPVKSLSPQMLLNLARQIRAGQLTPATMTIADGGHPIITPILQPLAH